MTNGQMREAFESLVAERHGHGILRKSPSGDYQSGPVNFAWDAWQAGIAAGMERAKVIAIACDMGGLSVGDVIDAIRAEIKGTGHEG